MPNQAVTRAYPDRSWTRRSLLAPLIASATQIGRSPLRAEESWQRTAASASSVLSGNTRRLPSFSQPVLLEGSVYEGIWMECGPHQPLVYANLAPAVALAVALASHRIFFAHQRPNGRYPANIKKTGPGYGQAVRQTVGETMLTRSAA